MSKRHADSTPDEKAPKRRKLSADEVLVEAARNGNTTAVREGLEKLRPDTDSKTVAFDAVHEACRGNHDECLALLLPYVETTQMGFGMLLSECVHADHTACTEVLLQHWKSVCSNVASVRHGSKYMSDEEDEEDLPCPAMWEDPAVCQVLIDAGADIETKDENGHSPLLRASVSGKFAAVKMLVEAGADLCVTDNGGFICLSLASCFGHTETVRYLVGLKEVDVNHADEEYNTALHWAGQQNCPDVVRVLIDAGADIEAKDDVGCSPLLWACRSGMFAVVKILVEAGADVRVTCSKGDTCLILAACCGHTETVRYLVGLKDVDVNHKGGSGCTAVLAAANHADVVEVLIDAGADIEARDNYSHSPLLVASQRGELRVVQMLVRAGAGVCVTSDEGDTCISLAAVNGHTETVRALLCMPEVDVNESDNWSCTPLHRAAFDNYSDVVRLLIDAGADVEATNSSGCASLHRACEGGGAGELEIVKTLVEAGADVCAVDAYSNTCLILAAVFGHTDTVRYLVGLPEVDVHHEDNEGRTALHFARQKQHTDVEQVLLKHGAEE